MIPKWHTTCKHVSRLKNKLVYRVNEKKNSKLPNVNKCRNLYCGKNDGIAAADMNVPSMRNILKRF